VTEQRFETAGSWAPLLRLGASTLCWGVLMIVWFAVFDAVNAVVLSTFASGGLVSAAGTSSTAPQALPLTVSATTAVIGWTLALVVGGAGARITRSWRLTSAPWWVPSVAAMLLWILASVAYDGGASFTSGSPWLLIVGTSAIAFLIGQAVERHFERAPGERAANP
jgi:hypothetical protein